MARASADSPTQATSREGRQDVEATVKTVDKYGRMVGRVMIEGRDVSPEMLKEGMAWHYLKYDNNPHLQEAEQRARAANRGLWQDEGAIHPSEWRGMVRSRLRVDDPVRTGRK